MVIPSVQVSKKFRLGLCHLHIFISSCLMHSRTHYIFGERMNKWVVQVIKHPVCLESFIIVALQRTEKNATYAILMKIQLICTVRRL